MHIALPMLPRWRTTGVSPLDWLAVPWMDRASRAGQTEQLCQLWLTASKASQHRVKRNFWPIRPVPAASLPLGYNRKGHWWYLTRLMVSPRISFDGTTDILELNTNINTTTPQCSRSEQRQCGCNIRIFLSLQNNQWFGRGAGTNQWECSTTQMFCQALR